ncbi:MAG TPA: hypothetical protein VIJ60_05350 [Acidimicrobiales bacterium]
MDDETGAVVVDVDVDDVGVEDEADDEELPVARFVDVVAAVLRLVAVAETSDADEEARKAKAPVRVNPAAPRRAVRFLTRRRPVASLDGGGWWCPMPPS